MDVVVKSRHCSVAEEFRALVEEKLARLEKLDDRVIRVEVEVTEERNKRQHDQAHCVEITLRSKGPVVRAEAASTDKIAALDMGPGPGHGSAAQGSRPQEGPPRPARPAVPARGGGHAPGPHGRTGRRDRRRERDPRGGRHPGPGRRSARRAREDAHRRTHDARPGAARHGARRARTSSSTSTPTTTCRASSTAGTATTTASSGWRRPPSPRWLPSADPTGSLTGRRRTLAAPGEARGVSNLTITGRDARSGALGDVRGDGSRSSGQRCARHRPRAALRTTHVGRAGPADSRRRTWLHHPFYWPPSRLLRTRPSKQV